MKKALIFEPGALLVGFSPTVDFRTDEGGEPTRVLGLVDVGVGGT